MLLQLLISDRVIQSLPCHVAKSDICMTRKIFKALYSLSKIGEVQNFPNSRAQEGGFKTVTVLVEEIFYLILTNPA